MPNFGARLILECALYSNTYGNSIYAIADMLKASIPEYPYNVSEHVLHYIFHMLHLNSLNMPEKKNENTVHYYFSSISHMSKFVALSVWSVTMLLL